MFKKFKETLKNDKKERNRILILFIGGLFIYDYILFSYHTDKNIFDIFPSIPVLDERVSINIYLPSLDGKTLLNESRLVPKFNSNERFVKYLFSQVVKGSLYKNTSKTVPVDIVLRNIWIPESKDDTSLSGMCIVDIETSILNDEFDLIAGSEGLFKSALEKTIIENIKDISKISILVQGIPDAFLWEI